MSQASSHTRPGQPSVNDSPLGRPSPLVIPKWAPDGPSRLCDTVPLDLAPPAISEHSEWTPSKSPFADEHPTRDRPDYISTPNEIYDAIEQREQVDLNHFCPEGVNGCIIQHDCEGRLGGFRSLYDAVTDSHIIVKQRCKFQCCVTCFRRYRITHARSVISNVLEQYPDHSYNAAFVSVRDCSTVAAAKDSLETTWKRFLSNASTMKGRSQSHPWHRVRCYVATLEISRHKHHSKCVQDCIMEGWWHPHFNFILILHQNYSRMDYKQMQAEWKAVGGHPSGFEFSKIQGRIWPIVTDASMSTIVNYLTKYLTKTDGKVLWGHLTPNDAHIARKSLFNTRFIRGNYRLSKFIGPKLVYSDHGELFVDGDTGEAHCPGCDARFQIDLNSRLQKIYGDSDG